MMKAALFTIGHSSHPIDDFLALLESNGVTAVADVRSTPGSRFYPQYNRIGLGKALASAGIKYVFLGTELGARSNNPDCYVDGKVQYDRLASTDAFQSGIERLLTGAASEQIAITCTERDPLDCHRCILVSNSLMARGASIGHILANGAVETHADAMMRLRSLHGLSDLDLFRSADDLLVEAMKLQEDRIAYVKDQVRLEQERW
jgi:uncharacterized protein (DUF488 family)